MATVRDAASGEILREIEGHDRNVWSAVFSPDGGRVIPPACQGHLRKFTEADKRQIVQEASQTGATLSAVARCYGIAARVLFR